jgi:hypothetical protein
MKAFTALNRTFFKWNMIGFCLAIIAACGGGGGGGGDSITPDAPTTKTLVGVAAAGAPIAGIVNVKGSNGATASSSIGIDGSYSIDIEGLLEPYILYAEGSVNGKSIKIYSASITEGRINITPITDFILRNAFGGHAEDAFNNWENFQIDSSDLTDAETDIQAQLDPVLSAVGVSSDVDLVATAFAANHTGIDLALDILDIRYSDNIATVTNNLTGSIFTDDITLQNDGSGFPESDEAATMLVLTDAQAINDVWKSLEDLYETSPTNAAIVNWIEANVAIEFLSNGENKAVMQDQWTTDDGPDVGITLWSEIFKPYDISGTTYIKGYWIRLHYSISTESESFLTLMVFNGTDWLWYGDRKWMDFGIDSHAFMWVSNYGPRSFQTGLELDVEDEYNYAYNQGARSAIVTGPGLQETGIVLEHSFPENAFNIYPPDGGAGAFYAIFNDSSITSIPDNAEYTLLLCSESAAELSGNTEACTVLQQYKETVMKPPLLNSELNASLFASLIEPTSHDASDLNFGGEISVSWTIPENTISKNVHLTWWVSSMKYEVGEENDEGNNTLILDATGLPAPDGWAGLFIRVGDRYERDFNMGWELY